eukprot:TRINITY_DN71401_c0_g1_i1.p1 TRINITY_DN71401_c0_g1~~TRINITY_DN71401_c0_g1_i1.p1  ORF type:complete len:246 (-),score=21.00 TRINITY_DN71401_c0_g1_i1:4-741(-)
MGAEVHVFSLTWFCCISRAVHVYSYGWWVLISCSSEGCHWSVTSWLLFCQVVTPFFLVPGIRRPLLCRSFTPTELGDNMIESPRLRVLKVLVCFVCFYFLFLAADFQADPSRCQASSSELMGWVRYLQKSGLVKLFGLQVIASCAEACLAANADRRPSDSNDAVPVATLTLLDQLETVAHPECYQSSGVSFKCIGCSVCLDNITVGDSVKSLPCCGNTLHHVCLQAWLERRLTCPLCRSSLRRRR